MLKVGHLNDASDADAAFADGYVCPVLASAAPDVPGMATTRLTIAAVAGAHHRCARDGFREFMRMVLSSRMESFVCGRTAACSEVAVLIALRAVG
jgi:hypothetical protein